MLPIHFAFLYRTYRLTGFWTGGYLRYYIPLWPVLAAFVPAGLRDLERFGIRAPALIAFVLVVMLNFAPVTVLRESLGLSPHICPSAVKEQAATDSD